MTVLRRWLEARDFGPVPLRDPALAEFLGIGRRTPAGVEVSETTAMRNTAVLRAVTLIADTVAGFPIKVFRDRASATSAKGEREDVTANLPLFTGEAYPDMTWFEWKELMLVHLLLWGNAYALKIRNEAMTGVVRVLPIRPDCVQVRRVDPRTTQRNPSGKEFLLAGQEEWLTPAEIMHVPGLGYDGVKGMSVIEWGRNAIGTAIAAEDVAAKLFDSGLLNGGFIQAERELTEPEANTIKQRWREKVAGIVRSYEVQILAQGLKYIPATIPPKEAQWLEARQFGIQEIARLYGVPADSLMDNSATGNTNVADRATSLQRFCLQHWVDRLQGRMSAHLVPNGSFVELTTDAYLRSDAKTRAEVYALALDPEKGWMTRAEVRALENLATEDDEEEAPPAEEPAPPPLEPVPDDQDDDEEEEDDGTSAAAA